MRTFALITSLVLALGLGAIPVTAQNFGSSGPERFFRVEAEGVPGPGARPRVRGYVYNGTGQAATRVQLLVESLDGSGQVIGKLLVPVYNIVPSFGRAYFDAPIDVPGASYRVVVYYYDWVNLKD